MRHLAAQMLGAKRLGVVDPCLLHRQFPASPSLGFDALRFETLLLDGFPTFNDLAEDFRQLVLKAPALSVSAAMPAR